MTDMYGATNPVDSAVTIPVEGKRPVPGKRWGGAELLPTERTAGLFVLGALVGVWVIRRIFDGALGD